MHPRFGNRQSLLGFGRPLVFGTATRVSIPLRPAGSPQQAVARQKAVRGRELPDHHGDLESCLTKQPRRECARFVPRSETDGTCGRCDISSHYLQATAADRSGRWSGLFACALAVSANPQTAGSTQRGQASVVCGEGLRLDLRLAGLAAGSWWAAIGVLIPLRVPRHDPAAALLGCLLFMLGLGPCGDVAHPQESGEASCKAAHRAAGIART